MPCVPHAVAELHPRLTFETKASQIHSHQQGVNGKARQVLPSPTLWKVPVFLLRPHLLLGSRSALLPLLAVPHPLAPCPAPHCGPALHSCGHRTVHSLQCPHSSDWKPRPRDVPGLARRQKATLAPDASLCFPYFVLFLSFSPLFPNLFILKKV